MMYLSGAHGFEYDGPVLMTPNSSWARLIDEGRVWAADTGCFTRPEAYDDERYLTWLGALDRTRCLFATAPDVVGDATATLARSRPMLARLRELAPVALVAQDGLTIDMVPWDDIDALFIGGTTAWKLGPDVPPLVAAARTLGKWAHMGRVNSGRRFEYARSIGCQSVDGTNVKYSTRCRDEVYAWVSRATRAPMVWEAVT